VAAVERGPALEEAESVATWDVRLVLQLVFASGQWQKVAIAA